MAMKTVRPKSTKAQKKDSKRISSANRLTNKASTVKSPKRANKLMNRAVKKINKVR